MTARRHMGAMLSLIVVAVSGASLAGCARTTLLVDRHQGSQVQTTSSAASTSATTTTTPTSTPAPDAGAQAYIAALSREQAKLAAAERRIPRSARTPAGLAHSIRLLRRAIVRLGRDLRRITPPASVAAQHSKLVSIVQAYASGLAAAAHASRTRRGELRAVNMLIDATTTASSAFGSTVREINAALKR